jgi:hypothetical protein
MHAFLPCREIFEDTRTREYILVGPFSHVPADAFPLHLRTSFYILLGGGHGRYSTDFCLRDFDGEVVWRWEAGEFQHANPLLPFEIVMYDVIIDVPKPGKYELVISTNGTELGNRLLYFGPHELFAGAQPNSGPS